MTASKSYESVTVHSVHMMVGEARSALDRESTPLIEERLRRLRSGCTA
jgi:hypothetical protein